MNSGSWRQEEQQQQEAMAIVMVGVCGAMTLVALTIMIPWGSAWSSVKSTLLQRKARGMSRRRITALPCSAYSKQQQQQQGQSDNENENENENESESEWCFCAICLGSFLEGQMLRIMPVCRHEFHINCVDKWLRMRSSCPICRISVASRSSSPFSLSWATRCFPGMQQQQHMVQP